MGKGQVLTFTSNASAFWRNVPAIVCIHKFGGYLGMQKMALPREGNVLDRALSPEEVRHFTDTGRYITEGLLVPYLDA